MLLRLKLIRSLGVLVVNGLAVLPSGAVGFFDGFEDGNTTANPAWLDRNEWLPSAIAADPVRPNNLVWKVYGHESADRSIGTFDFTEIPWSGFHASVEYLTTSSTQFRGHLGLTDGPIGVSPYDGQPQEAYLVELWREPGWSQANLHIREYNAMGELVHNSWFDANSVPVNEWLRISLWHDPDSGLVKADVRTISDNQLIHEASITPLVFGGPRCLSAMGIGITEQAWQYLDNATLTPEPAALVMVSLGGLLLRPRRRR